MGRVGTVLRNRGGFGVNDFGGSDVERIVVRLDECELQILENAYMS